MGRTKRRSDATPVWVVGKDAIEERVKELFGKRDRRIAKRLVEEFYVAPDGKKYDELTPQEKAQFDDAVRRTVHNYRKRLLEKWKSTPLPKPGDKAAAYEFIAKIETRIEELERIVEGGGQTKTTAQVNAAAEIRQCETLIAAVKNVDVAGRRLTRMLADGEGGDEEQVSLPFYGLVLDWRNVSNETKEKLIAGAESADANKRHSASTGKGS